MHFVLISLFNFCAESDIAPLEYAKCRDVIGLSDFGAPSGAAKIAFFFFFVAAKGSLGA